MVYELSQILDLNKVEDLLKSYTKATGLVSALLDCNGNVLSKSGWQKICTDFHRVHPVSANNCRISDTTLANRLNAGSKFNVYKCLNGLVDIAVPVIVDGQHLGNLFTGQFFFEEPDLEFFKKQAKKYDFEENTYFSALKKVPVLSESDIRSKLDFLSKMTEMLAEQGLSKIFEKQAKEQLQRSEKKYRELFENLNEGFALHEIILNENGEAIDYRYLDVNPEFERITGLKADRIIGKTVNEVLPGVNSDPANWIGKYGEVALKGKNINFEEYSEALDKWFQVNSFSPRTGQFAVTFSDISERRNANIRLLESENKFRALIEQSITGIYIFTKDKFLYVNQKFCDIFGYTNDEILNTLKPTDVVQKEERARAQDNIDKRLAGKVDSVHYFAKGKRKDERELWIEIHGTHIELDGKQVVTGTVLDITAKYQASIQIEESELKFRSLFEQAAVGVAIIETETGNYHEVNQRQCEIVGYDMDEFLKLDFMKITHPDDLEEDLKNMERLKNGEVDMFVMEKRYFHKSGSVVWVKLHVARLWLVGRVQKYHVAICEDITQNKRAEIAIVNSEKRFRGVVEQSLTGIYIFDEKKFVYVNRRFAEIFGYTEIEILKSVKPIEVLAEDERSDALERIRQRFDNEREFVRYIAKGIRKDKSNIWIEVHGGRIEIDGKVLISGMVLDVTDKIKAEQSLKQQNDYLGLLKELDLLVMQSKTIGEFTRFALLKLSKLFDCDNAIIKEYIKNKSQLKVLNANISVEIPNDILNRHYQNEIITNLHKQQAFINNHLTANSDFNAGHDMLYKSGIRSILIVPMVIQNNLFGALEIMSKQRDFFSNERIALMQSIAQHISVGIDKILIDIDLKEHAKRLEEAQRIGRIGSWEYNAITEKGIWSKELFNIAGLSSQQVNNGQQELLDIVVSKDKEFVKNKIKEAQSSNKPQSFEFQIQHKDKKHRVVNAYIEAQHDSQGNLKKMLGSIQDVTENKQIRSELMERDATYKMLFDTAPDGILIADSNSYYLDVNPAMCAMLGYTKEEIITFHATDIVSPVEYTHIEPALEHIKSKPNYHREWLFRRKDGTQFSAEVIANNMPDGNIMAMVRDITDRKLAEEKIKKLNQELEARVEERTRQLEVLNKELRAFTYSVSHDLKAPLRGINGYSKLLLSLYSKSLNEEAQSFIENIRSGTDQMNVLIDDLLNYSRLERTSVNIGSVDVESIIQGILRINQNEIKENHIQVDLNIKKIETATDRNALTIALRNVIENAIKFTKNISQPHIEISLQEKGENDLIIVKDNGIGFDMAFHDKIFDIFQRLHRIEEYEGTGIGLAIVKKAMSRIGGSVWAESGEMAGASFYLQFPKSK